MAILKVHPEQLLKKHLKYMRLTPEDAITAMSGQELTQTLNVESDGKSEEELRELFRQSQRYVPSVCGMIMPQC